MKYRITHSTKYAYSVAVPVCHNLVCLQPRALDFQCCNGFRLVILPEPMDLSHRLDRFGNYVSYFSIEQPHHGLAVTSAYDIDVRRPETSGAEGATTWESVVERLRTERTAEVLEACQFVAPSPRIRPFEALSRYARPSFSAGRALYESVVDLTRRVHEDFSYDPRATTVQTPIEEVFEKRHGVCQDFAHLQVGCLRAMGLAARYVSGYLRTEPPPGQPRLIGSDASHAWLSVYCGDAGWIDFDPTNNAVVADDYVTLAWGRDYNDVSPIQGVIVGGGEHRMHVAVDVVPIDDAPFSSQSQSQSQSQ